MIIVIGAGPAGLATAYYLQKEGLPYRILEQGTVGYAWQNHYDRLRLHTLKEVSALPGRPMPDAYPRFPSANQMAAYLQEYADHFELNIETGVEVQRARYQNDRWQLETNRGAVTGETLIAATGIWSRPHRPRFAGEGEFGGTIIHAKAYRNPAPFAGQRVLVVGGGNTGCEIAVELSRRNVETSIAVRSGIDFVPFPTSPLLMRAAAWFFRHAPAAVGEWVLDLVRKDFSHLGLEPAAEGHLNAYPVVGYELPQAVEAGRVTLYNTGLARLTPTGVVFEDGRAAEFETVILATGYRPALAFIADRDLERDASGQPCLENGRSTRNPHLYCVGYHYPATAGWLQTIGRVARRVVTQLA